MADSCGPVALLVSGNIVVEQTTENDRASLELPVLWRKVQRDAAGPTIPDREFDLRTGDTKLRRQLTCDLLGEALALIPRNWAVIYMIVRLEKPTTPLL
jgi:hypothetical protein